MSSSLEDQRAGYCRHCGDRLPLIKRVKREEFCSEAHREKFLSSSQLVALDRLRETAPEAILAPVNRAVAVAEEEAVEYFEEAMPGYPAEQSAEAADPPMAGTVGPAAVNAPQRMRTIFEDASGRIGQWEPVKPEPQWQNLALRFGLAEFTSVPSSLLREAGSEAARTHTDHTVSDPNLELVFPNNSSMALDEMNPAEKLETLEAAEREAIDAANRAPAPLASLLRTEDQSATFAPVGKQGRWMATLAEATEIDTTLYLPAFSPQAASESFGNQGWSLASWLGLDEAVSMISVPLEPTSGTRDQALHIEAELVLPLGSGCQLIPAECPAEPSASEETPATEGEENDQLEPEPCVEAAEGEGPSGSLEDLIEQINAQTARASQQWEERAMSEAVQSRTEGTGLQALGERIANPFLHEPQPRPGSGTPRWSPVTVSLGTGQEATTEDWDIL